MSKVSSHTHTRSQLDHHATQLNPNNTEYQQAVDNRANQLNPNNDAYWSSRGIDKPETK